MTSSAGPYQSRFFNFVVRQSRQLANQYGQTIRRLKVGVLWGVQLGLYPLYVLFQGVRLAGQQLQQGARRIFPQLQAVQEPEDQQIWLDALPRPEADRPIQAVLQAARALSLPGRVVAAPEAPLQIQPASAQAMGLTVDPQGLAARGALTVRAIASQLQDRTLVLVSDRNEVLNILTTGQQHQLRARIAWEVAHYWRQWRQLASLRHSLIVPLPAYEYGQVSQLPPPVRLVWQLMAWVQRGAIASAVNLFQESALVACEASLSLSSGQHPKTSSLVAVPAGLDYVMARLEAGDISPILEWTSALTHQGQASLQRVWSTLEERSEAGPLQPSSSLAETPYRMLALIRAAIAYFLGRGSGTRLASESPHILSDAQTAQQGGQTVQPQAFSPAVLPFLFPQRAGSADLGGLSEAGLAPLQPQALDVPSAALPQTPGLPSAIQAWAGLKPALYRAVMATLALDVTALQPVSHPQSVTLPAVTQQAIATSNLSVSEDHATVDVVGASESVTATPRPVAIGEADWIEPEVTVVGYVKHPLEQLLEWLDRAMLWLENRLIQIGRWLMQWWQARH